MMALRILCFLSITRLGKDVTMLEVLVLRTKRMGLCKDIVLDVRV